MLTKRPPSVDSGLEEGDPRPLLFYCQDPFQVCDQPGHVVSNSLPKDIEIQDIIAVY